LRAVETLEKVFFRLVPRPWTTAMIATEMPAAMRILHGKLLLVPHGDLRLPT
jgi:hypothetical protein